MLTYFIYGILSLALLTFAVLKWIKNTAEKLRKTSGLENITYGYIWDEYDDRCTAFLLLYCFCFVPDVNVAMFAILLIYSIFQPVVVKIKNTTVK